VQATKQQQIMGYFIEEAKEHLDTIEQGLLNLQSTMADSEQLNELFRAAHSVKGGAAMLGLNSIQKISHHLEDCFKVLKENPVKVDRQVEDLFLSGFDALKALVEALQSPYGLQEEEANQLVQQTEPTLTQLQSYLDQLTRGGASLKPVVPTPAVQPAGRSSAEISALINGALKKMLELFKQGDSPTCRQQLTTLCHRMVQVHPCGEWQELMRVTAGAIANSRNSYQQMAPVIIKEVKLAGDLLAAGKTGAIIPSPILQQFAGATKPAAAVPPATGSSPATTKPRQITIPGEPKAAAKALLEYFNKQEIIQMAQYLMKAIQ